GRGRDGDTSAGLPSAGQQHEDATVVAVEGDQSARVEGDAGHQAAEVLRRFFTPSVSSAQRRSSADSSPPVSPRAAASMAPQPATSSRATPTACCTNPDTLGVVPDSTSARMRSSWPSSRVIVTFLVAILITIPSGGRTARAVRPPRVSHFDRRVRTEPGAGGQGGGVPTAPDLNR